MGVGDPSDPVCIVFSLLSEIKCSSEKGKMHVIQLHNSAAETRWPELKFGMFVQFPNCRSVLRIYLVQFSLCSSLWSDIVLILSFNLYQIHQFLSQQKCIIHRATTVFDWSLVTFIVNHVWSIWVATQLQTCHIRMDWWCHSFHHMSIQHYLVLRRTLFLRHRFDATL